MYASIVRLKEAGPDDLRSLYAALSGGEPLPASVREAYLQKFHVPIYEGYGLTETIGPIAFNIPGAIKPGSVGQLIPGAEARIIDDNAQPLTHGETGEICLRGPMVTLGYYNLPEVTAASFTTDRYFKTGDLGHMDGDGFLYVTGRKKEIIIVAGEKVAPREIEDLLLSHPTVAEAAVVGKKDASRGEVVVAFVIAREGQTIDPEGLRGFAREQGLPGWKVPRDVYVVTELPRSPTGKVLKRVLVEKVNAAAV
jgi:long-chain acyl-CoA synthetase